MSNTIYVSDLDGTLLQSDETISKRSLSIINQLIEEGMKFTYATARSLISSRIVSEGLTANIPVIVYNGAFIMNYQDGKILHANYLNEEVCEEINTLAKQFQIHPIVYAMKDGVECVSWNCNYENEGIKFYLSKRKNDPRFHALNQDDCLFAGKKFYLTCIGEKAELQPMYDAMKDNPNIFCTFQKELYRDEYWLEIMSAKATKAQAIQALKKFSNYDHIVSFGDALNDIAMFEISDDCYAVENANPLLKEKATSVIASNDEDAVASWLWDKHKSKG